MSDKLDLTKKQKIDRLTECSYALRFLQRANALACEELEREVNDVLFQEQEGLRTWTPEEKDQLAGTIFKLIDGEELERRRPDLFETLRSWLYE